MQQIHFIGANSCWGAQIRTCEEGPDQLKNAGLLEVLPHATWESLYPSKRFAQENVPLSISLPLIIDFNERLRNAVQKTLERKELPIIIGGDHSIAVGTWSGVAAHIAKPMGLLWIDAHMDAHTPETSPSGAWHGMPLAALLGHGEKAWVKPIIKPENLCLIGTRSFEAGEQALLKRLNVRIYEMAEVKKRGFKAVLAEATQHICKHTAGYGISLDVDVVDPIDAPGVGSPEQGGIRGKELLEGLHGVLKDPRLKAFEMVEFNPTLDSQEKTAHLCIQILKGLSL